MKSRLRWLSRLLIRGPHAEFIRHDLEEIYARDRAAGVSSWQAHRNYARDLMGSVVSVRRAAIRRPSVPGVGWLDLKLAGRMLLRYPGITLVGGFALMMGIPVSIAPIQLFHALNADLPFRESKRIVGLEYWQTALSDSRRASANEFERWQRELTSFESLAAGRRRVENIVGRDGLTEVARGAEITASAFTIVDVQPLLGRRLLEADQVKGAEPVVVIGHDLWQKYFDGNPAALGQTIQLGHVRRAVVGVMPPEFQFPIRETFWVPLPIQPNDHPFGEGPRVLVFGRLRDGVSREQAQTEFRLVGQRIADEHPATHQQLRPDVMPFAHAATGLKANWTRTSPMILMTVLLLAVTCGNVGTLMLARAATRSNEIAVRNALGAGRARIVMQLFIETLLLATIAGAAGLVLADAAVTYLIPANFIAAMPFWFDLHVKPFTAAIAAALIVFSAVIAGLLPALKATRANTIDSLKRQSTGVSGLRFGRTATVLIVIEVAIAVGGLSGVGSIARGAFGNPGLGAEIAAEEFLTTELALPVARARETTPGLSEAAWRERFVAIQSEVSRRLTREPGVRAVTFATTLPGMDHRGGQVEVEGDDDPARSPDGHRVRMALVEPGFFPALGQNVIMGRDFATRDLRPVGRDVIVNRSFVDQILHGRAPIGRRLRYLGGPDQPPGPWREIIGVVNDLGMNVVDPTKAAGVYHVITLGEAHPIQLVVRLGGDPAAFVPRLRSVLNEIEPGIVLDNPVRLDEVFSEMLWQARFSSVVFSLIAVIGVVLSAAGLYALMAFSVSQRTREIAIRTALGARRASIVRAVVARALVQLTFGVAFGVGLAALIVPEVLNESIQAGNWRAMLAAVATGMVAIGLLACAVPTRRALRIQPVEALKEQG